MQAAERAQALTTIVLTDQEFDQFSKLIYAQSGICLNENKKSLVVSRLSKRIRELGLPDFSTYYATVVEDASGDEFVRMLDLISTNKTDFFREPKHFDFLREQVIPQCGTAKRLRIWSSACSSGEEPYTIAMTIADSVTGLSQWDCRILASDLSTRVLDKAATGVYDAERVEGLSPEVVKRHFLRGRGAQGSSFKVKPALASMVVFRRINLMADRFPIKSPLDVIFCRNVMIYFDRPTQAKLMAKFYRYLRPGGYLFIGHSESLQWVEHQFTYVAPTIYQKAPAP